MPKPALAKDKDHRLLFWSLTVLASLSITLGAKFFSSSERILALWSSVLGLAFYVAAWTLHDANTSARRFSIGASVVAILAAFAVIAHLSLLQNSTRGLRPLASMPPPTQTLRPELSSDRKSIAHGDSSVTVHSGASQVGNVRSKSVYHEQARFEDLAAKVTAKLLEFERTKSDLESRGEYLKPDVQTAIDIMTKGIESARIALKNGDTALAEARLDTVEDKLRYLDTF